MQSGLEHSVKPVAFLLVEIHILTRIRTETTSEHLSVSHAYCIEDSSVFRGR
jgi:hypothetical protein